MNIEWDDPALAGLRLEARAVHTGAQPASADNAVELESWTRFDAGVRYAFEAGGKPLTLRRGSRTWPTRISGLRWAAIRA